MKKIQIFSSNIPIYIIVLFILMSGVYMYLNIQTNTSNIPHTPHTPQTPQTPHTQNQKSEPAPNDNQINVYENFDFPSSASSTDINGGASSLYGWGDPEPSEDTEEPDDSGDIPAPVRHHRRHHRNPDMDVYDICRNCDITLNKDIDKYVLKSSVPDCPECPDLSNYVTKNQMLPDWFNPDDWIRKTDIPPCPPCPDLSDYVLKSEIPVLVGKKKLKCPVCPICPTCPKCPVAGTKVVERVIYKNKYNNPMYSGVNENQFYKEGEREFEKPKHSDHWIPKLSDSNSGFIDPNVPMAGNAYIFRRSQELL